MAPKGDIRRILVETKPACFLKSAAANPSVRSLVGAPESELETPLARRTGQRGDSAVVLVRSSIEDDFLNSLFSSPRGKQLADSRRRVAVARELAGAVELLF